MAKDESKPGTNPILQNKTVLVFAVVFLVLIIVGIATS